MAYNFDANISQGSDSEARAAGFGDFADYQNKLAQRNDPNNSSYKDGTTAQNGGSTPAPDFNAIATNALKLSQQNIQPAVTALQATKQPLQDRYTALLDQIKNNQGIAENRQTVTTNNELGARGILPSSGLAQKTLTDALNPITQDYNATYGQTVAGENSDLANVDAQIAQLVSGAGNTGLNLAGSIYGANLSNSLGQGQLAETTRANKANEGLTAAQNALQTLILRNVTLPQSQASINSSNANAAWNAYQLDQYKNNGTATPGNNGTIDPNSLTTQTGNVNQNFSKYIRQ